MSNKNEFISESDEVLIHQKAKQFSAFYLGDQLYGIEVNRVQEVVLSMAMTPVPLAPNFVRGLINLRGQVATAINLRELFEFNDSSPIDFINIVCRIDGALITLQVDEIGDVIEVSENDFELIPKTISEHMRQFLIGVYKVSNSLMSAIDIDNIYKFLNHK
jgi:purine-binding chemotaxis protein CheW